MSYQNNSILGLLQRIDLPANDRERLILPYIQRDFVWSEEKITSLLDSIMRGYPIGTVLFWETKREMKFREFDKFIPSAISFLNKDEGTPCTIVLDGQQRLQSLYTCCQGTLNGKEVYFNILSGISECKSNAEVPEIKEKKPEKIPEISYADEIYEFKFLKDTEVNQRNANKKIFIKLKTLLRAEGHDLENFKIELEEKYSLAKDEKVLMLKNITILREVFNKHDFFSFYTIDKALSSERSAKNISEILEIFVRVNSTGIQLSKSELVFSLIKSKWGEAFETFENISKALNVPEMFHFDNDFIIKCLLTIHTGQSRFSLDSLDDKTINKFLDEANIKKFTASMVFLKRFLEEKCLLRCDAIFNKSYNTLLPVVYYIYNHPNNIVPETEERKLRFFVYSSLMKKYISRYTDNRVPKLLKDKFADISKTPHYFPLNESLEFLEQHEGRFDLNDDATLNANVRLVLNIVYGGIAMPSYQNTTHKDLDHIYPKSKLEGYSEELINNFGNFRYIDGIVNKIKSNTDPLVYFKDIPEEILLQEHLVDKNLLSKDQYDAFITDRKQRIKEKVKCFLAY